VYIQSAYSLPDEDKQKQEQRPLTLTDDTLTKIFITTDDIPTHTMPNGIIMINVFDYLLN
jgi:predicted AAA+ superfamily ATPase